jgi:hypothetical protein
LPVWATHSFLGFVPLQGPSRQPEIPSPTAAHHHQSPRGGCAMASSVPHPARNPAEAEPHTEHRPRGEPREQGHRARWADAWTTATHDPKTAATAAYASGGPKPVEARHGTGATAPKCERGTRSRPESLRAFTVRASALHDRPTGEPGSREASVAGEPAVPTTDVVEVCPELKSRGARRAAGCPAACRRSSPTFLRFLTSKNVPKSVPFGRSPVADNGAAAA